MEQKYYGRREDPTPVKCKNCGWEGQRKDTIHEYQPDNEGDVECIDKCPVCYYWEGL